MIFISARVTNATIILCNYPITTVDPCVNGEKTLQSSANSATIGSLPVKPATYSCQDGGTFHDRQIPRRESRAGPSCSQFVSPGRRSLQGRTPSRGNGGSSKARGDSHPHVLSPGDPSEGARCRTAAHLYGRPDGDPVAGPDQRCPL